MLSGVHDTKCQIQVPEDLSTSAATVAVVLEEVDMKINS